MYSLKEIFTLFPSPQFVCVESLVTAIVDMYPSVFRRKNRRELFLLAVVLFSFLMGLIMLMEVEHTQMEAFYFVSYTFSIICVIFWLQKCSVIVRL